jgi:hypothetical protein
VLLIIGAVLPLAMMVARAFWTFDQIQGSVELRNRTQTILYAADDLSSVLKDIEASVRIP